MDKMEFYLCKRKSDYGNSLNGEGSAGGYVALFSIDGWAGKSL